MPACAECGKAAGVRSRLAARDFCGRACRDAYIGAHYEPHATGSGVVQWLDHALPGVSLMWRSGGDRVLVPRPVAAAIGAHLQRVGVRKPGQKPGEKSGPGGAGDVEEEEEEEEEEEDERVKRRLQIEALTTMPPPPALAPAPTAATPSLSAAAAGAGTPLASAAVSSSSDAARAAAAAASTPLASSSGGAALSYQSYLDPATGAFARDLLTLVLPRFLNVFGALEQWIAGVLPVFPLDLLQVVGNTIDVRILFAISSPPFARDSYA